MHPLGTYLAIMDRQREQGWAADDEWRDSFARVDAMPVVKPEPVSRIGRLVNLARRLVLRTASA